MGTPLPNGAACSLLGFLPQRMVSSLPPRWGSILPPSALGKCLSPAPPPADYHPQSSPGALPELPAFLLFLCLRHADHCRDEPRARSLLDAAINAIKRVMKVLGLAPGGGFGLRSRSSAGQRGGEALGLQPGPQGFVWWSWGAQPEHPLRLGGGLEKAWGGGACC